MPPLTAQDRAIRITGIGASEIAGIVGLNPYQSALEVWASKMGHEVPREETEAMDMGHRLEPVTLQLYSERVCLSRSWSPLGTVRHSTLDWCVASPDGEHVDGTTLVECKAPGFRSAGEWGESETDDVPDMYLVQAQWQMFVTGRHECRIAALIGGQEFRWYPIKRDDGLIGHLRDRAKAFWFGHVIPRLMPDPDGSDSAMRALTAFFPRERKPLAEWTPDALALAFELAQAKNTIKTARSNEARVKELLCKLIGDSAGFDGDGKRVTWKAGKSGAVSWKSVAMDLHAKPADIAKHTGDPTRTLRMSGFGSEEE